MSIIYGITISCDVLEIFAQQILTSIDIPNTVVLVPSHRIGHGLKEKILEQAGNESVLLPRIIAYPDLAVDTSIWLNSCPNISLSLPKTLSDLEFKKAIVKSVLKLNLPVSNAQVFADFCVKFYTYCGDKDEIKDNRLIFKFISEFEAAMASTSKILPQQLRQIAVDQIISSWEQNTVPIFALLPTNARPYIYKLLRFLSTKLNCKIYTPLPVNWQQDTTSQQVKHLSSSYFLQKFLKETNMSKHSIRIVTNAHSAYTLPKLLECCNQAHEARLISVILREKIEKRDNKIALICEDRTLAFRIIQQLKVWDIKVNDTTESYLLDSQLSDFFFLIYEFAIDQSSLNLIKLLKHPYSKYSNLSTLKDLDTKYLRKLHICRTVEKLKSQIKIEDADILRLIDEFSTIIIKLLNTLPTAFRFNIAFEEHLRVLQHIVDSEIIDTMEYRLLLEFSGEILKNFDWQQKMLSHDYEEILKQTFALCRYRNEEQLNTNISIVTLVESRLQKFDTVFIVNANEASFPSFKLDRSILGYKKEEKLGFETLEERLSHYTFDLEGLLCNKEVVITRSWNVDNVPQTPASFLDSIETINDIKYDYWQKKLNKTLLKLTERPQPNPIIDYRPKSLYVSAIEKLLRDPYAYYAEYILKLKRLDQIWDNKAARDFGNIFHSVISEVSLRPLKTKDEFIYALIQRFLQITKAKSISESLLKIWLIQLPKIAAFIWDYESRNQDTIKLYSEINGTWELNYKDQKIKLSARADRIDIKSDGRLIIIDYKTGYVPTKREIVSGVYPQLAIEGLIAQHKGFNQISGIDIKDIKAEYIEINGSKITGQVHEFSFNDLGQMQSSIEQLIELFYIKNIPYFATLKTDNSAKTKHYKHLSRLDEWFDRY